MDIIICIFFALEAWWFLRKFFKLQIFWFHLFLWTMWLSQLAGYVETNGSWLQVLLHVSWPIYPACQWHQQLCIPACCILLPWLCNCSFWDFAATKVRLGMECLKLSSIGAVIVDHLDQRAGVQSEGETAMTTGLRFLPGPRADSWRSSDPGKQWTLWR